MNQQEVSAWKLVLGLLAIVITLGVFGFGIGFTTKAYGRYQAREDAQNEVDINRIRIRQQEQRIEIEKQDAQIRIEEAYGIAESQRIIDESLTGDYLTYLAIQAQMEMADSPNHSVIYLPSGAAGVPLVRDISGDESGGD